MHPLALWFLVFLSGGSQRIVNQVCLSQQWVLLSSRDVEVEERGREREIVPDLTFLCDTCNRRAAGSAVPPRFHRIILRMPLERFLLLLLSKQYCWQCNICFDSSPGCNFQLNLFPPSGDLKLEESKWATIFFIFCISVQGSIHMNMPWYSQWSALRASLASSHRVSIREGFEWTEVEPPVRCVLQRRKTWSAEGRHSDRRRETDRQEEREGKGDKDAEQQNRELIYRFTCVHGWISLSSLAGTSRCVSSSAWLIDMTHLLGCTRLLGPTDCEKLRYPNERTR